jgi:acetyl coenzyme A synthetase (ADP forming)-like protein
MPGEMLSESEGYELLKEYDIPVPAYRVATNPQEAARAAAAVGYPVVMKVISPDIVHKSDAGGVLTGIGDDAGATNAFETISSAVRERSPEARIEGVMIEQQLPRGLELLIGGKSDPSFGKVITFGIGGTMVELLRDVSIRVLPISREEIREMVREIHGYPLIKGFRGGKARDEDALVNILEQACRLFFEHDDVMEFDINPLILYEKGACAVDARFIADGGVAAGDLAKRSDRAALDDGLFYPESIALVGASSNPNKIGYALFRNLLSFEGKVYPVNPNATELLGRKVYPALGDLPESPDMVIVAVPAHLVPRVMEEAGAAKAKLAVIISAGFRETGEDGKALENEVVRVAKSHGIRVIGPNCLGIMLPHRALNATFDPTSPRPGPIGFISQSGAVITTVVDWSLAEDIGISAVISVGNQADLEVVDFMKFAVEDPNTKTVILYVEEIKNGRRFLNFAREISGKIPTVAIKSGSSQRGREAASSHTGSLAGSFEVYSAAFRQAGVMQVHSLREAFDVAGLLASEGYPEGRRAVIVTSAGGFAVLSSDYAEENGIELITFPPEVLGELDAILPDAWSHENPIDMLGDAGVARFAKVFDILIRHQDEWDIAFVVSVPSVALDPTHLGKEIVRFSMNTEKMVVGCLLGGENMRSGVRLLRNAHIPNFSELEDAFKAVGIALERKSWLIDAIQHPEEHS